MKARYKLQSSVSCSQFQSRTGSKTGPLKCQMSRCRTAFLQNLWSLKFVSQSGQYIIGLKNLHTPVVPGIFGKGVVAKNSTAFHRWRGCGHLSKQPCSHAHENVQNIRQSHQHRNQISAHSSGIQLTAAINTTVVRPVTSQ